MHVEKKIRVIWAPRDYSNVALAKSFPNSQSRKRCNYISIMSKSACFHNGIYLTGNESGCCFDAEDIFHIVLYNQLVVSFGQCDIIIFPELFAYAHL